MKKKIIILLPSSILEKIPKQDQENWIVDAITEKIDRTLKSEILEEKDDVICNKNDNLTDNERRLHDMNLYSKLFQDLNPKSAIIRFLRDEDIGSSFRTKDLYAIYDFVDNWDHAQCEFLDSNIERCRKNFIESLSKFSDELKANTWLSRHDQNLSSIEVPDYDFNHPKWKKVDELNELKIQTFRLYDDLIRVLKNNLGLPMINAQKQEKLSVINNFQNATIGNFANTVLKNQCSEQNNNH